MVPNSVSMHIFSFILIGLHAQHSENITAVVVAIDHSLVVAGHAPIKPHTITQYTTTHTTTHASDRLHAPVPYPIIPDFFPFRTLFLFLCRISSTVKGIIPRHEGLRCALSEIERNAQAAQDT